MLALCGTAMAQQLPETPQRSLDQTRDLQEKQQLERRIDRDLREQLRPPEEVQAPPSIAPGGIGGARFLVSRITVANDDQTDEGYAPLLAPYLGTEMGRDEIFALLRELTNYYARLGYVTTTVTLTSQSLKDGGLEFRVNWGYVEGWLVDGRSELTAREGRWIRSAMPGWEKRVLNIRDVDQAVENLSNGAKTAQIEIVPSERIGRSYLNLKPIVRSGVAAAVDIDNSGSENPDGHYKYNAQVAVSDVLGWNDTLAIGGGFRHFGDSDRSAERNATASYSLPWGPWLFALNYSWFDYRSRLEGAYGAYESKGDMHDVKARLSRVVSRNQTGKTSAWVEVGSRDSANYVADWLIDVSSRRYSAASVGVSKAGRLWGGAGYADLAWSRGVSWFGAYAVRAPDGGYDPLYTRWKSNLSWVRALDPFGQPQRPVEYSLRIGLQYSADRLLSANQLSLGDEYTVRGYKGDGIAGDSGAYISNTFALPLPVQAGGWINTVTPFVGFDIGAVRNRSSLLGAGHTEAISGVAVGLRLSGRHGEVSVVAGLPTGRAWDRAGDPVFYLRASFNY